MTSADAMRASDGDREKVVHALQEQVGEGRLTLEEFEERSAEAYQGKTVGDLRALTKDLPVDPLAPPRVAQAPWLQPFPMPGIPPWAQRTFPTQQQSQLPQRRTPHPLAIAGLVLMSLFLIQAVVGAVIYGAGAGTVALPLLFLAFILLRRGGGGRRRYR
jgi:Domain of unknown function (DUF1707)